MTHEIQKRRVQVYETIATLIAEESFLQVAEAEILRQQTILRAYIERDSLFRHTLEPYAVPEEAPDIVRQMADAAARMGVGPMAAVAGAIAEMAVKAMVAAGATHAIVENGGDIVMVIDRPLVVGVFTGPARIRNFGLRFLPRAGPIAVCTSSGTVGHSLSFGRADAATVIAADGALADAAATALGNRIKSNDHAHIREALATVMTDGIEGMLVVADDAMGMLGDLPALVAVPVSPEIMTG